LAPNNLLALAICKWRINKQIVAGESRWGPFPSNFFDGISDGIHSRDFRGLDNTVIAAWRSCKAYKLSGFVIWRRGTWDFLSLREDYRLFSHNNTGLAVRLPDPLVKLR
jgi:hypothetical protein